MVGDRLMTDMRFAVNNGFKSVLVLSGEATAEDAAASGLPLDAIVPSIAHILV
jgi:ribonucleotide monophosphatase NagD (HAD superfamily)